jgi:hypothetical protein
VGADNKLAPSVMIDEDKLCGGAGRLKRVGGSQNDDWNSIIADQTVRTLLRSEELPRHCTAAMAGLVGINPKDELEGMMAAQLIAGHTAAMECYRRAMLPNQTFEGRGENLTQANKLSRTYAVLLDALNRHRGKGQQKVTVEHVHVHSGGQAVVGVVETAGGGDRSKSEGQPLGRACSLLQGRWLVLAQLLATWRSLTRARPSITTATLGVSRTFALVSVSAAGYISGKAPGWGSARPCWIIDQSGRGRWSAEAP